MALLAKKNNFIILADEVYEIYDYENIFHSFLHYFSKNIFCLYSLSKSFSMCGWRLGWGIGDAEIIKKLITYQSELSTSPHTLSQLLAIELFNKPKKLLTYFASIKNQAKKQRDFAISYLQKNNIDFIVPEGGIAMLIKIPTSFKNAFSFAETLLIKRNVAVAPGEVFGQSQYFRINLTVLPKYLKIILDRVSQYY